MNTHYRLPNHVNLLTIRLVTAVVILIALYTVLQPLMMNSIAVPDTRPATEVQASPQPRPVPVPTPPQSQQAAALPPVSTPAPAASQPQPVPQPVPTPPTGQ